MPSCLTLSINRYVSRVKWSNPGKGVVRSPTPWYSSYWKGAFGSPLTKVSNFKINSVINPLCLSRVKWSNPGKGVVRSPTPWCSSYWKGAFGSPYKSPLLITFSKQYLFYNLYCHLCVCVFMCACVIFQIYKYKKKKKVSRELFYL